MEHHSNIVPWQLVCEATGARLRVAPIDDRGELDRRRVRAAARLRARGWSSITHMSNALGTVNPVREIVRLAHAHGVPVLVDGSQAAYHMRVDVQALDCDFYVATGHKLYGPTGIGVLYGKDRAPRGDAAVHGRRRHDQLGDVRAQHLERRCRTSSRRARRTSPAPSACTPRSTTSTRSASTRSRRTSAACWRTARRCSKPSTGVRLIGTAPEKASILSFVMDGVHPHDIGTIVDREGIAIRTGHHCAQPVMERFGDPGNRARVARDVQHREELDALGPRACAACARCSPDVGPERPLSGGHPRPQPPAEELPRARRMRATGPRATIRCAATG